jgi:hypothetical protein
MSKNQGNLLDYLAASFIGLAIGLYVSAAAAGLAEIADWGAYVAVVVVGGLFLFIPAGFVSAYINFRFHRMSNNKRMAGLSAGLFTATVYTIVTLITSIIGAIAFTAIAANFFIAWILGAVFAFILMMIGGYLEGGLEDSSYNLPAFFSVHAQQTPTSWTTPPPPPPPKNESVPNCPICGKPMKFIEEYHRWYCYTDKRYG